MAVNCKAKGTRNERRAKATLEAESWFVVRAAGSLGLFDLVALHVDHGVKLIQVRSNHRPGGKELTPLRAFLCYPWRKEVWVYWDGRSDPDVVFI